MSLEFTRRIVVHVAGPLDPIEDPQHGAVPGLYEQRCRRCGELLLARVRRGFAHSDPFAQPESFVVADTGRRQIVDCVPGTRTEYEVVRQYEAERCRPTMRLVPPPAEPDLEPVPRSALPPDEDGRVFPNSSLRGIDGGPR